MLFTFPSRYWFAIGLSGVFSLAGWSRRIHAGFLVPRATQDTATLHQGSCTQLSCGLFPVRSPLLGESLLFSFPAGTKMFQFPALASIADGCHPFRMTGCPIRRSADQRLCAPPRGFSQLVTSFIASESLGIRRAPFLTSGAAHPLTGRRAYTFGCLRASIARTYARFSFLYCLSHHVIEHSNR